MSIMPVARQGWTVLGALVILSATGCSNSADFGKSVTVPKARHTRIDTLFEAGRALRLPDDMPFNLADAQRFSQGDAAAESTADPSGTAGCSASARAGGNAWAEFQLGQVLTNTSDQPFECTVTFNITYGYRTEAGMGTSQATPNMFALKIHIMDSNQRVLKQMMLAELEPAKGPTAWAGTQTPTFDVTFEPHQAYHLVLAARVQVAGSEKGTPSAHAEIKSLGIEVAPRQH